MNRHAGSARVFPLASLIPVVSFTVYLALASSRTSGSSVAVLVAGSYRTETCHRNHPVLVDALGMVA